ncbi:hypothetical protein BGP_5128 [Beggiatoa sp. PS]|nr:hypothetical protein BGP_5128 [Beggiatoa sp. PS]
MFNSCYPQCFNQKNPLNPNIFYPHDLSLPLRQAQRPPTPTKGRGNRSEVFFSLLVETINNCIIYYFVFLMNWKSAIPPRGRGLGGP